jgi:glycosyltransferase involved in cell wall biosynthesis
MEDSGNGMKLAIVSSQLPPISSGVSNIIREIGRRLIDDFRYDVVFYTMSEKYQEETIENFHIKRFPVSNLRLPRYYTISKGLLQGLLKERFDIIHSHHFGYFPATAGFLAAKAKNTPHVFTLYYHPPIYGFRRALLFLSYHLTQGLPILRGSDRVLPLTRYEKNMLVKIGAKEANMEIIPGPIDTGKFKPIPVAKEDPEIKTLLYISPLVEYKGAHVAFQITEQILEERDDFKVIFIGGGPLERTLKDAAGKRPNFVFLPALPREDLIKWYNRADIFVLPSLYESFGMVLVEAQACGLPCISTKVGGIPEVVEDGKTGFLVDYGDWRTMRENIEFLLDNEKVRKSMGKNARRRVISKFDSKIVVKKLVEVYESVA